MKLHPLSDPAPPFKYGATLVCVRPIEGPYAPAEPWNAPTVGQTYKMQRFGEIMGEPHIWVSDIHRWCPAACFELAEDKAPPDPVNRPAHYTQHPSGVETIQITEHMNFCRGNAIKYIWRAGEKGNEIEDLRKAAWYISREIKRLEGAGK